MIIYMFYVKKKTLNEILIEFLLRYSSQSPLYIHFFFFNRIWHYLQNENKIIYRKIALDIIFLLDNLQTVKI